MTNLSDYVVTARLRKAGKWQAEIRRKDGKEMRVEGTTKLVFTTMLAPSSSEAIGLAYQAIDSNEISIAGDLNVVDVVLTNPSRMTPKRFRIYYMDIGGKPDIFQGAFTTTADAIAFSCKPEEDHRILVAHKKSYSIDEFKTFAAENKFDNGGRP